MGASASGPRPRLHAPTAAPAVGGVGTHLFMASPWRFSSAVHLRVQDAHAVSLAPVSSRVPSSVFNIVM